jgi:hypothetical protein
MKTYLLILILLIVYGCSSQNIYDSIRYNRELECQKMQGADRDECSKRSEMNYDEYKRQLENQPQK